MKIDFNFEIERLSTEVNGILIKIEKLTALRDDYLSLIGQTPLETIAPTPAKSAPMKAKTSRAKSAEKFPDQLFTSALTNEFDLTPRIHERIAANGQKLARNTIVNRLRKLASDPASGVRASDDNNQFKIVKASVRGSSRKRAQKAVK